MRRIVLDTNCLFQTDYDDNKFVDCAIAADAEYIVSNDKHFSVLETIQWPKLAVVKMKDFAAQLANNGY